MFEYLSGKLATLTAANAVVDCGGVGYMLEISLNTYSAIQGKQEVRLWVHEVIREDAYQLYGFYSTAERDMFRLLLGVNGVGAATARMMLSSLSVDELQEAIIGGNVARIKSVKGIGAKTAERIILELKDKIVKGGGSAISVTSVAAKSAVRDEAAGALVLLGFSKPNVEKALDMVLKQTPDATLEILIKNSLKIL